MIEWTVNANKRQAVGQGSSGVFRIEPNQTGSLQVAYMGNNLRRWVVLTHNAATMVEAQRIAEELVKVEHY